jgi:hypothetical protein
LWHIRLRDKDEPICMSPVHRERVVEDATPLPDPEVRRRLARLSRFAWLLDRSIPLGGKWRIGLDPILGLIPGFGDWVGAVLSLYLLYEGARLGVPANVVARMAGNILVETILGAVPVLGDLFDFAWQANIRNLALIERHHRPELRAHPLRRIWLVLLVLALLVSAVIVTLAWLVFKGLAALFS